jgi:eukaryotic-like serine/threonine-protein kinase
MQATSEQTAAVGTDGPEVGAVLGPYRLVRRLGAGMTSTVFEVEHLRIARRAAMKIMSSIVSIPNVADRFVVEARAVNAIRNPHIVEITDILESPDGRPLALVMELLEGESLCDLIGGDRTLSIDRVMRILAELCEALAAVHAAGFAHRDLKPENVFLVRRDGDPEFVKLLDFGLVKPVGDGGARPGCGTLEGTFLGSPAYASPEQAAGKSVDLQTDIYSLGVMAFELLTGELPFMAAGFREVLMKHMVTPPPHLPPHLLATALGQTLDGILQTCLAKEAADRVLSAQQLAETFHRLSGNEEAADRLAMRRPSGRRHSTRTGMLGGAIALATLLLVLVLRHHHGPAPAAMPPPVASAAAAVSTPPVAQAIVPVQRATGQVEDGQRERPKEGTRGRRAPRSVRPLDEATTLDPFQ